MPDFFIKRETERDLFGSTSTDRIEYVARGLSSQEIAQIAALCLGNIASAQSAELLPIPNNRAPAERA
jgi:hypothetical protein